MELHQVRYFVALCKSLNFTRAARECQVTQPALTRGIQRLEQEFGGPLFRRERSLTQLTELGRVMRPLLEQTLAMAEAATISANRFNNNELASLRIGLPPVVSAGAATKSLSEVARRIPTLEVKLFSAPQSEIVDELLMGGLDGAFLTDSSQFPERLNTWLLYTEEVHLALPATHPLACSNEIPIPALDGLVLVECTECSSLNKLKQQCAAVGITFKVPYIVDSYEQAQHFAAGGLGIMMVPEGLPLLPSLVSRRIANVKLSRSVIFAVVCGRRYSTALNAFVRLIRARDFSPSSMDIAG